MNGELPKILTVSINAWRDNSGINTLTGILSSWDSKKVAQIYTRSVLPHTVVCNRFFQISEGRMIRSIFKRNIVTGTEVKNKTEESESEEEQKERKRYQKKGKIPGIILTWAREFVWILGKWKSSNLDRFMADYAADVLFIPIYPTIYMGRIQKYVIMKTKKPVVSYIADDNYSYLACAKDPLSILHRFFVRRYVKYIIENSEQVFVIAPKQKEEYDRLFGINSKILTKGIDFSQNPYHEKRLNTPIKMIYTGKLLIGRWKSLALIAEAIEEINKSKRIIELDIYTTDSITKAQAEALNRNGCRIRGALNQRQVREVQSGADILVFVESLERKYRNIARLSFSTKLTDYMASGKCIFAVGDKNIAPIDYFNRYDAAITASSRAEIGEKLNLLVNNPNIITQYSKKGYECGVEHHQRKKMNHLFVSTICSVVKR